MGLFDESEYDDERFDYGLDGDVDDFERELAFEEMREEDENTETFFNPDDELDEEDYDDDGSDFSDCRNTDIIIPKEKQKPKIAPIYQAGTKKPSENDNSSEKRNILGMAGTGCGGCLGIALSHPILLAFTIFLIMELCTNYSDSIKEADESRYAETYGYKYDIINDNSVKRDAVPDSPIELPYKGMEEKYIYSTSLGKADKAIEIMNYEHSFCFYWYNVEEITELSVKVIDGIVSDVTKDYSTEDRDRTPASPISKPYEGMYECYMYSTELGKSDETIDVLRTRNYTGGVTFIWCLADDEYLICEVGKLGICLSVENTDYDGYIRIKQTIYNIISYADTTTAETTTTASTYKAEKSTTKPYDYNDYNGYDDYYEYDDDIWEDYFDDEEYDADGWEPDY